MKLKTRLIIAFFTIVILPIAMAALALMAFGQYQIKVFRDTYGIENYSYETFSNSTPLMSQLTKGTYKEMKTAAEESPELFLDSDYQEELNTNLLERGSYLIIRKGSAIVYAGSDEDLDELMTELPSIGDYDSHGDSAVYLGENLQVLVKQVNFAYAPGGEGSAFIVTRMDNVIPQIKNLYFNMIVTIIIILVVTGACLMGWIYGGIMVPLNKLRLAAQNIKDGNLDFHLELKGNHNEIEGLCMDFEQMRRRLKNSAEEKIEHDKESKELISNISHDLKTPITSVKGYVEGIMDGVADTPEKMDKYIRTIYNKANEMDRLINELTFYAQIDTNRIPYTFSKINVSEYFQDCVDEIGLDLEAKKFGFSYSNFVDENVEIIADAEQIKRVIHNIVNNAVKYNDKDKGYIHIRINDAGDYIQVEIEDNGKGIAAKDLPHIFDRFYRTDTSRNSAQGGSGIGLSIVRKIVEEHGGKIWATSKESIGTVMCFVLRKYEEVLIDE